jgi:hypothetical protein
MNDTSSSKPSIGERYVQWTQNISKFSYVTVRGVGKMERTRGSKTAKSLSMKSVTEKKSLLIWTQSVAFCYTDFCTTLYFVNQRNF